MGNYSSFSAHASVEVDAPAAYLWKVVADIEASPLIISMVQLVNFNKQKDRLQVGTTWTETRLHRGKGVVLRKTVTELSDQDPYILKVNVGIPSMQDTTNTSTLMVEALSDGSSLLVGTFAVSAVGGRMWHQIWLLLYGKCSMRMARKSFQKEMEEYKTAAEVLYYFSHAS